MDATPYVAATPRTREAALIDLLAARLRETYPLLRQHAGRHDWQRVRERVDAALADVEDYRRSGK